MPARPDHARATAGPKRWKLWILTCVAIYPVITALGYAISTLGESLPLYARFAFLVPVAVALLVFVVMPALTRRFARWLAR